MCALAPHPRACVAFCRLRGDVDSWSVVDLLKTRKVWAQCDDVCGTFYYPKKKEAKDESKPKKAAPGLNKHADKVDPYLKSGQKVVTAALAVLPPQDQWEQIQRVREAHDKAFQRWPPHINLYAVPFGHVCLCTWCVGDRRCNVCIRVLSALLPHHTPH